MQKYVGISRDMVTHMCWHLMRDYMEEGNMMRTTQNVAVEIVTKGSVIMDRDDI